MSLSVLPAGVATSGSGQLLTKVTRTDPALIQYAVQAFGTSNLSEDDWKKAEDHYKVMFIYLRFMHELSSTVLPYMCTEINL
jgi:splicing factor 4